MFCTNCGRQNPDDANYCNNCGKPVKHELAHTNQEQYWETCEILCKDILKPAGGVFGGSAIVRFAAYAIGHMVQPKIPPSIVLASRPQSTTRRLAISAYGTPIAWR